MRALHRAGPLDQTSTKEAIATVDCDVHQHLAAGLGDLMPYLPAAWRSRLGLGLGASWTKEVASSRYTIPHNNLYVNPVGSIRRDARAESGTMPASEPKLVAEQLLDKHHIDRAVLLGGDILGLGAMPDPDVAAAIAGAYNDWMVERWLEADVRFRGLVAAAPQDPTLAAAEIERSGQRQGVAGIFMPLTNILMGDRHYYPIYAAAQSQALPVFVHPNSVDGIYAKGPTLAGGIFTYYTEWHAALTEVFHANLISLVCHGVFERFPNLRVVIAEGGFAWVADAIWRLDKNWQSLRDEVPWLKRRPSEYVADHIRFTTQPLPEPRQLEHLAWLCEIIQGERTLLYSSDYPHWDFDNPLRTLETLPEHMRARIRATNALELFGDRML